MVRFEDFVELNKVIPLTIKMAKTTATIQADLRKKGTEIGHTDTLIAGIAITSEMQLVTNNTDHFKRIKGLGDCKLDKVIEKLPAADTVHVTIAG
jgi:tRNA(fMet)-specific endonuclease VapC